MDDRKRFVGEVTSRLTDAGARFAVLDEDKASRDSDVDIVASRDSLDVIDIIVRSGAFGVLLQRFDYDVPWCRYYIVRRSTGDRRYRQIDVACDPWGIGRYGIAVPAVTERLSTRQSGRADAASRVVYLAVKRARKGDRSPVRLAELVAAFEEDPSGCRELLERVCGASGRALADAIETGGDPTASLAMLDRYVLRVRRRPAQFVLRMFFRLLRLSRRVARPTGLVVCLVGPDGVGKSSLAAGLIGATTPFRGARRLGQRRGFLPPPWKLRGRSVESVSAAPHDRSPASSMGSLARITYRWLDTLLGWGPKIAAPRLRSNLVVLERGWDDLLVDPRRYRVALPSSFLRVLRRFQPHPDLTLVLEADVGVVSSRKSEITPDEISRQTRAWRDLAGRATDFGFINAGAPADAVLLQALDAIDGALAARQHGLDHLQTALDCLGGPGRSGVSYTIVAAGGVPRWLLPLHAGRGVLGAGLHRPRSRSDAVKLAAFEQLRRARLPVGPTTRFDVDSGIAPLLAEELGRRRVTLAGTAPARVDDGRRGSRALLAVIDGRDTIAYVKVVPDAAAAETEANLLSFLAGCEFDVLAVPPVLALLEWRGNGVLLLGAIETGGLTDRPLGESEVEALSELGRLGPIGSFLPGRAEDEILVHGDFTPFNTAPLGSGKLAVWDWEAARWGLPLEDVFHWRFQALDCFARGTVADIVRPVLRPDGGFRELCDRLGVEAEIAPTSLRRYLESGLAGGGLDPDAYALRVTALSLLTGQADDD